MKHKRNHSGESTLAELRQQNEDINLSSEMGLDQVNLDRDGDRLTEQEISIQTGDTRSEATASVLPRKKNEPLIVTVKEHLPQDQERAATEGVCSKVLAHPDDAIGKVYGPENGKRVRGFSNVVCPSGFRKSKRIFGAACGDSSSVSQQHVADLERQLQQAKDKVATLHKFLLQKYDDEVPTFSDDVPHT